MQVASVVLDIERKFFRDAKLSWVNEESSSIARLTFPLMNKARTKQILGIGRDVISLTVAVFTAHCDMGRHAESMNLLFSNFALDADPLSKRKLLTTFFISAPHMLVEDIGYLAPQFLSALRSYHLLISRI